MSNQFFMTEKKIISVLDEHVINKIAAGEVIEDSASIIKELLENSIDAQATSIEVKTKSAGRRLITISDNGFGIPHDEIPLAFLRHATSKIRALDDLFSLKTFGFRGEALASLAAVSKCTIISATEGNRGHKVISEGGKVVESLSCARQKGTTIEVRDLFYNTPVRKKFQKSSASALREIHKVLMNIAFAFPHISLRWISEENLEFHLLAERDLMTTVSALLGSEYEDHFFPINEFSNDKSLKGLLSVPYFSKINRSGQFVFVNGRAIISPLISEAVNEGYGTRISSGRYPHFILFLEIPPHQIDVNVHPQKKEIRFDKEAEVFKFIRDSIQKALEKRHVAIPLASSFELEPPSPPFSFSYVPLATSAPERELKLEEKKISFSLIAIVEHTFLIERENKYFLIDSLNAQKRIFFERIESSDEQWGSQSLLFPITLELKGVRNKIYERNILLFQKLKIEMRPIGKDSYIIDALPEGIDAHNICDLLDKLDEEKEEKRIAFSLNHLVKRKILSLHEAYKLVETLFSCKQYALCPEGKPTIIPWPKEEIGRLFL